MDKITLPSGFAATVRDGDLFTINGVHQVDRRWWQFGKVRPYEQRWWHRLQFWRPSTVPALQQFRVLGSDSGDGSFATWGTVPFVPKRQAPR